MIIFSRTIVVKQTTCRIQPKSFENYLSYRLQMKLEKGKTIHLIFGSSIFSIQKKQMKFKRIRKFFSFFPVYVYVM